MIEIKRLFFLCYLFATCNVNAIEHIEFELNGLKIGDKLTEKFENDYCPEHSREKKELECKRKLKIGGVDVYVLYFFNNLSLVAISLSYKSSSYHDLVKVYSKKFSAQPHKNLREPIDLRTGEQYTNEKVLWVTSSGNFIIEKYGNNFTRGYAHLDSHEYIKYLEEKKKEMNKDAIRKIFSEFFD